MGGYCRRGGCGGAVEEARWRTRRGEKQVLTLTLSHTHTNIHKRTHARAAQPQLCEAGAMEGGGEGVWHIPLLPTLPLMPCSLFPPPAFERSPIDNLDMNETGVGGWRGQFYDQSFHAWQYIMFYRNKHLTNAYMGQESPFVIIAQSSATLVPYIHARCYPGRGVLHVRGRSLESLLHIVLHTRVTEATCK